MNNIYHIVGLNNLLKDKLIYNIDNIDNCVVIDLEQIKKQVINCKQLKILSDQMKRSTTKKNEYKKELYDLWREIFQVKVDNYIKKNRMYENIILIGTITLIENNKIKINLDTDYKFLIDIKPSDSASQIVEYYIDKNREDIILGKFPLEYLDKNLLEEFQKKIFNIYQNMKYKKIKFDALLNLFDNFNDNDDYTWYVGTQNDNGIKLIIGGSKNNKISKINKLRKLIESDIDTINNDSINAYKYSWLALLSSIKNINNHIIKGFINKNGERLPFIEEKYEGAFDVLNTSGYINKIKTNKNHNNYKNKIIINNDIDINYKIYIKNIKKYLNDKIKLIYK